MRASATAEENGGWPPHLHFQIILDLLDLDADFPGVAFASQRAVWTSLSPDPNLLVGIPKERFPAEETSPQETLVVAALAVGKKSQPLLPEAAENRSRLDAISLR